MKKLDTCLGRQINSIGIDGWKEVHNTRPYIRFDGYTSGLKRELTDFGVSYVDRSSAVIYDLLDIGQAVNGDMHPLVAEVLSRRYYGLTTPYADSLDTIAERIHAMRTARLVGKQLTNAADLALGEATIKYATDEHVANFSQKFYMPEGYGVLLVKDRQG